MNPNHSKRPRLIAVHSVQPQSPNLTRIVFHSEELADYPFTCAGAHIKLLFPLPGQSRPELPEFSPETGIRWHDKSQKPYSRTYTIRAFDRDRRTITVDFVLHGDNGPASAFAMQAQTGQLLGLSAPSGPSPMLKPAAHYLFAADLTGLPAVSAMLEAMAADAAGDVLLWLPDAADLPDLPLPQGITLHTFFAPAGDEAARAALCERFALCRPPHEDVQVWIAGEAAAVRSLRHTARSEWGIPLQRCYAVPYWRSGESEEAYHRKRHDFMDEDGGGDPD